MHQPVHMLEEKMSCVWFVVVVLFLFLIKNARLLFLLKKKLALKCLENAFSFCSCPMLHSETGHKPTNPSWVHSDLWLPIGPYSSTHPFSECLVCAGLGSGSQSAKQTESLYLSHLHNTQMSTYPAYFTKCIVEVVVSLWPPFSQGYISIFFSAKDPTLDIRQAFSQWAASPTFRLFEPVSLCASGSYRTYYATQAGLKLMITLPSLSARIRGMDHHGHV